MSESEQDRRFRLAQALQPQVEPRSVEVSWSEYSRLLGDSLLLSLLEERGVPRWEGYDKAYEALGDLTDWP